MLQLVLPFCACIHLPYFLYRLVDEKQRGHIKLLRVSGLSMGNYWISHSFFFLLRYFFSQILLYGVGRYKLTFHFFEDTSFIPYSMVIIAWGVNQIALAIMLSTFLTKNPILVGYSGLALTTLLMLSA